MTGDEVVPGPDLLPINTEMIPTSMSAPPAEGMEAVEAVTAEAGVEDAAKEARRNALTELMKATGDDATVEASNGTLAEMVWESETIRSSLEDVGIDPSSLRAYLEKDVDGTSTLEILFKEFSDSTNLGVVPKAGKYTYLCISRETMNDGIADLILCHGDAREGRNALGTNAMSETVLLPVRSLSISYRRTQILVDDNDGMQGDGMGSMNEFDESGMGGGMGEYDDDDEAAFRQRAEEEYERNQDNDDLQRDQQRTDLIRLLREAESENNSARAKNAALDKQAALYLHSLGSKKTAGDANDKGQEGQPRKSQSELGQQYATTLRTIGDNLSRLERDQITYDREALELQARLEEKEEKVESVREAFTNFKSEIAKAAENSRSGKPIPRKIIRQFEEVKDMFIFFFFFFFLFLLFLNLNFFFFLFFLRFLTH